MKRRIKTTTETHEVWVVWRPAALAEIPEWCAGCGGPARMLAPEAAAALCGLTTRAVYALVEAGRVHFQESAAGAVYVCLTSLPRAAE